MSAADPEPIGKHRAADPVQALCCRHEAIADDVQRRFVWDQQRSTKEICLSFNPSVQRSLALFAKGNRRRWLANVRNFSLSSASSARVER